MIHFILLYKPKTINNKADTTIAASINITKCIEFSKGILLVKSTALTLALRC